jgi:hypothetical protein
LTTDPTNQTKPSLPKSFWLIASLGFIWNALGSVNYFMQMNAGLIAVRPVTEQAIIIGRPAWATAGFAVGVFAGTLGCLLLLFRTSKALLAFAVSIAGIAVTMIHTLQVAASTVPFTLLEIFFMAILPLIMALLLLWYTKHAEGKGWIS